MGEAYSELTFNLKIHRAFLVFTCPLKNRGKIIISGDAKIPLGGDARIPLQNVHKRIYLCDNA